MCHYGLTTVVLGFTIWDVDLADPDFADSAYRIQNSVLGYSGFADLGFCCVWDTLGCLSLGCRVYRIRGLRLMAPIWGFGLGLSSRAGFRV